MFPPSSCAHLTVILSSSSICFFHSGLLPLIPFSPISPLIPSAQVSLGLPRFLLPGGHHFITSFGNFPPFILWTCPWYWSCLVLFAILSAIYLFILLSAFKMESRQLKFSTLSEAKLSIFRCVMSFITILFICIYLVLPSLIFNPTGFTSFCNSLNISLRASKDLARRATSSA